MITLFAFYECLLKIKYVVSEVVTRIQIYIYLLSSQCCLANILNRKIRLVLLNKLQPNVQYY